MRPLTANGDEGRHCASIADSQGSQVSAMWEPSLVNAYDRFGMPPKLPDLVLRAAAAALRKSAIALRAVQHVDDPMIADAHRSFYLPGVGEAFFTKWFAFAGFVRGRDWQPLILDSRVRATLHDTLDVWLNQLTDSHNDPARYIAYLDAIRRWAAKLPQPMTSTRLEWIMFRHNGTAI